VSEDVADQARVLEVVGDEALGVVLVGAQNGIGALVAGDQLAAPEQRLGGGLEAIVGQANEGAVHQREPVEHETAEGDRARGARVAELAAQLEGILAAADREGDAVVLGAAGEDGEVELRDVPPGDDVGVELLQVGEEALQQDALGMHGFGVREDVMMDDEHAAQALRVQRDREDVVGARIGLDVERQHLERRRPVAGAQRRIAKDQAETRVRLAVPVDLQRAADAAIDQIAAGEADVGLEAGDAGGFEAGAQSRNLAWHGGGDLRCRLAGEGAQVGVIDLEARRDGIDPRAIGGAHEEIGPGAIVDDQKRAAVLEHAVQAHLGHAVPHPVGRREDEAAHENSLPQRRGDAEGQQTVRHLRASASPR
jgi:hypothetical protein